MTQAEFKAWFDGFTEAMDSTPNEKQWKRIKERVKQIDGAPITYPVYIDRYWPVGRPLWYNVIGYACNSGASLQASNFQGAAQAYQAAQTTNFNSSTAMLELGRADASL